jgi:hypothetical protein
MVKENALTELGARVNFNASGKAGKVRNKAAQPFETVRPAPVGAAMQYHRMQARVAGEHLPGTAGSGVAVENALNIGAEAGKHLSESIR